MFKQAPRRDEDSTRRRRQRTISSQEFIFRIFKYLVLIFFLDDRPVWLLLLCVSRPNSRLHSAYLGSCVHGVFGLSRAVPTENHSTCVWLCASARIKRRRKARNGADGNRLITSRPTSRRSCFICGDTTTTTTTRAMGIRRARGRARERSRAEGGQNIPLRVDADDVPVHISTYVYVHMYRRRL